MRIDAHQHFWTLQRENDYGFLTPEAGVLYADYAPSDLQPLLARHGFQRCITVQAAPTVAETRYVLNWIEDVPFVAGVVGWLDMDAEPADFRKVYRELRQHEKFIGIRPMLQDLEDRWIVRPNVLRNLQVLEADQFPFDVLVKPHQLPAIVEMLAAVPKLRAVIDHAAKPLIRTRQLSPWDQWMEQASHYPNVWCKLSGMVTEADHEQWSANDLAPYVGHVLACFGPERTMFGSDWPVCLLAASYSEVVQVMEQLLAERLDAAGCAAVFGGNAAKFYKLS